MKSGVVKLWSGKKRRSCVGKRENFPSVLSTHLYGAGAVAIESQIACVELKIARENDCMSVERPLLRCRFRAGYLVRVGRRGWKVAGAGQAASPGVARQRQLGHSGPATHQLYTRSLPDTRFSITSIFNWASRSWKCVWPGLYFMRTLFEFRNMLLYWTTVNSSKIMIKILVYSCTPSSVYFMLNII